MERIIGFIVASLFVATPSFGAQCSDKLARFGFETGYNQLGANQNNNDWHTQSIGFFSKNENCAGSIFARIDKKTRYSKTDTSLSLDFNQKANETDSFSLVMETAADPEFSAKFSANFEYSRLLKTELDTFGSVILGASIGYAKYQLTDRAKIGIQGEIYPKHFPGWINGSIAQVFAYDKALPLSFSARLSLPVSDKIIASIGGGRYFETYAQDYMKTAEYSAGLHIKLTEKFDIRLNYQTLAREGLPTLNGLGLAIGLSL